MDKSLALHNLFAGLVLFVGCEFFMNAHRFEIESMPPEQVAVVFQLAAYCGMATVFALMLIGSGAWGLWRNFRRRRGK